MRRKSRPLAGAGASLSNVSGFTVRFSEVDAMQIVWHGNYASYLEDGREAFGLDYPGLGYHDFYANGYGAPIVEMWIEYKSPMRFGERAVVETRYVDCQAAKICFEYEIRRADGGQVVATAGTTQVFLDRNGELQLTNPEFYLRWKERWGVR